MHRNQIRGRSSALKWMILPGGGSSGSELFMSPRGRERFLRVRDRFGWYIPRVQR